MNIRNLQESLSPSLTKPSPKASDEKSLTTGAASTQEVASVDQVALSGAASFLSQKAPASTSFDEAKVLALRKAIADGSYRPDSQAIADKLIADHLDLLGPGH